MQKYNSIMSAYRNTITKLELLTKNNSSKITKHNIDHNNTGGCE